MSGTKKAFDLSEEFLETFLSSIYEEIEKEMVRQIVKRFMDCGLPVKTKQYDQPCMAGTLRIMCFIKKSSEAVIINNKGMGRDGMSIQVRIEDRSILDKIGIFSQSIRNQIINAMNCRYCTTKCESRKYVFTYQGNEYTKCHFLCSNFSFQVMGENDIGDIMGIISNEIAYKQIGSKKAY